MTGCMAMNMSYTYGMIKHACILFHNKYGIIIIIVSTIHLLFIVAVAKFHFLLLSFLFVCSKENRDEIFMRG